MMDGLVAGVNLRVRFVMSMRDAPYSSYLIKLRKLLLSSSLRCFPVQPFSQGVPSCTLLLRPANALESRDNE